MTFSTVELTSTFFHIPDTRTIDKWVRTTPDGFRFAAIFPRSVTHEGDLGSRVEEIRRFLAIMAGFKHKLGPLLMQFPASFGPESRAILMELLRQLQPGLKVAAAFRHRDWFRSETYKLLRAHGVALCLSDYPVFPRRMIKTADFVYMRFVGDRETISEDFSHVRLSRTQELRSWAEIAKQFRNEKTEIYAYFSNHFSGHAPSTAAEFREMLGGTADEKP